MRGRNVFLLVVIVLMGVFAWLNWAAFAESKALNLLFTRVNAPLGVVLLALMAVLVVVYFLYTVGLETAALLEVKRYARELLSSRKLADEAEASRFTELKKYIEGELAGVKGGGSSPEVLARLDKLEAELREDIERSGNTLAAYIGELEDQITGQDRHPNKSR
jgi:uncharacterized integral membrane protein